MKTKSMLLGILLSASTLSVFANNSVKKGTLSTIPKANKAVVGSCTVSISSPSRSATVSIDCGSCSDKQACDMAYKFATFAMK